MNSHFLNTSSCFKGWWILWKLYLCNYPWARAIIGVPPAKKTTKISNKEPNTPLKPSDPTSLIPQNQSIADNVDNTDSRSSNSPHNLNRNSSSSDSDNSNNDKNDNKNKSDMPNSNYQQQLDRERELKQREYELWSFYHKATTTWIEEYSQEEVEEPVARNPHQIGYNSDFPTFQYSRQKSINELVASFEPIPLSTI